MYKKITVFFAMAFGLLAEQYYINGEGKELDTKFIENYTYLNAKDAKYFGLNYSESNNIVALDQEGLELSFVKGEEEVEVNSKSFFLTNETIVKNGETYIDFDYLLYILNYEKSGNNLMKNAHPTLPLEKGMFKVDKPVDTIVSLSPGVTEKLYEIGAFDKLLARTDYASYPEEALLLPSIGSMYTPQLEKIVELNPNIVIAETHFKEKVLKKLNEAGIAIYGSTSGKSIEDIFNFTIELGLITDKYYEARGLNASLENKLNRAEYVLTNIKNKPRVYYVVGTGKAEYTAGQDTFIADLIRRAGAINVADDTTGWLYSLEKLIDHNPDYIFGNEYNINTMLSEEVYTGLSSIKDETYFIVDQNVFNLSGPRLINDGLKILIEKFHGEEYARELNY